MAAAGRSVVVTGPGTGYVSTLGSMATSIVVTVPVPAGTAARLLGWVLHSKTVFRIFLPTCVFFLLMLFSLWIEGIGGVGVALPGKAH